MKNIHGVNIYLKNKKDRPIESESHGFFTQSKDKTLLNILYVLSTVLTLKNPFHVPTVEPNLPIKKRKETLISEMR